MALGCATGGSGLEPRYVAVHNAMTAMGMAQTGSISEGTLDEGGEARLEVELGAGQCYTFMALGGSSARDMGVQVLSEGGEELGRDLTHDRQAAAQACPERAGIYQVVVTMNEGHGSYLVTSWSGAPAVARSGRGGPGQGSGQGSCADPQSIALGETVRGNTTGAPSMMQGSCVQSGSSPEHVYAFVATERAMFDIALESSFDGALYLMTACGTSELACNDDNPDTAHSRLRMTLDPGTYYVVVDGYGSPSQGEYSLSIQAQTMQNLAQVCGAAPPLTPGVPVRGDTSGSADYFQATCAGGAHSPDNVYRLSVAQPSRLRLRQTTPGHDGALYVRSACDAPASEVMCNDDHGGSTTGSMVTGVLQPGEYFVFSDGYSGGQAQAAGSYELVADLAPLTGGQANGDTCAAPLAQQSGALAVDTFQASDDMAGTCGGQGAPDVVMQVIVTARSRLRVTTSNTEFNGVVYVRGAQCAVATGEVACGQLAAGVQGLDTVLAPGTYHLVIDGADANSFGQADLDVQLEDLAAMERMCRAATRITAGRTINGTTVGETDNFQATCAGNAASPDRVYQLRLTRRMTVRAHMTTTDFDGALHIRRDCADATTEVACNDDFEGQRQSVVETTLDAGTYFIVVDGFSRNNQGSYSLRVDTTRP